MQNEMLSNREKAAQDRKNGWKIIWKDLNSQIPIRLIKKRKTEIIVNLKM